MKIIAVVVTYNRKELLMECLSSLLNQTFQLDRIILIDNASTDGTSEALKKCGYMERIDYRLMTSNLGGSGGFYKGLKIALKYNVDWVWIMDDDTVPELECLEKMYNKVIKYPDASFFASCVSGENDEPMNLPSIDMRKTANGYSDWYMPLREGAVIKIRTATFVSILVNHKAIKACGLPCKDFFWWADDSEYTARLTKYYGPAYLVGDSWVCHKRKGSAVVDIRKETEPNKIKRYFYLYRNELIYEAMYGKPFRWILVFIKEQLFAFKLLFSGKLGIFRASVVEKGLLSFIFQYKKFKKQIERELGKT